MARAPEHEFRRVGRWKLLVLPESWSPELWAEIQTRLSSAPAGKHPQTSRVGTNYFLKIYSPPRGAARIKDWIRDSRALRALKQTGALARLGFHAPPALAAGEERSGGALGRAFLLTREIAARPLAAVLGERFAPPLDRDGVKRKRHWIAALAREIRRLHRHGFVHGDLVASNLFVAGDDAPVFFYMDHDRTRRYPRRLPHRLWRRNLVQLNRFVLPGISLRDRMRFLKFYLGAAPAKSALRLGRWIERETRRRYGARKKLGRAGAAHP